MNRRSFLDFLGKGALGLALSPALMAARWENQPPYQALKSIAPCSEDDLKLAQGFEYDILIRWRDHLTERHRFGYNNDFTAFIPDDSENPTSGTLWVNHEYVDPKFVSTYTGKGKKTLRQVRKEMYQVGGSIVRINQDADGNWAIDPKAPTNRRLHALTKIPFNWPEPIAGSSVAVGTLANCSGGVTPWGTILTCEENYDNFWGERNQETGEIEYHSRNLQWQEYYDHPPEHYGWVVEVNLQTGKAQKHVALGRCAHE